METSEIVALGFEDHTTIGAGMDELNRRADTATGQDLKDVQDGLTQLTRLQGALKV